VVLFDGTVTICFKKASALC